MPPARICNGCRIDVDQAHHRFCIGPPHLAAGESMSLILEALRRSEAQRQLGRTPDVLTPMPVLRTPHGASNRHWWIVLLVVAVLIASWMGWRRLKSSNEIDHPPMLQSSQPVATPVKSNPGTDAVPVVDPPSSSPVTVSPQTSAPAAQTPPNSQRPIPQPSAPAAAAIIGTAPITKPALTAAQVNASALPPTIASLPNQAAASPPTTDAPTAPAAEALLPVNDLPTGERAALPALKVSMHVYAETPADRFMIIDGTRVGEGERIAAHIVLVKIRKDGGVLDIDGHRVLLPRP